MVQRWEYLTDDVERSDNVSTERLDALGRDGWELVLQRHEPNGWDALIFKRPLVEGEVG